MDAISLPATPESADDVIALVESVKVALRGFEQIAYLQNTCPLAAELAVSSLRDIRGLIAPEAQVVSFDRAAQADAHFAALQVPASLFIAAVGNEGVSRAGVLDAEIAGEQALDAELRGRS